MVEPAQPPREGLGRGSISRQRRVSEAIGEARAALQETLGMGTPKPRRQWAQRLVLRVAGLHSRIHGWRSRPRRKMAGFSLSPLRTFLPTLAILAVLVVAIAGGGFGVCSAYVSASAEGGVAVLFAGDPVVSAEDAFTFAAVPMSVVKRYAPEQDLSHVADADVEPPTQLDEVMALTNTITYTVQAGDDLESLAVRFQVTPYTIFWANNLHTAWDLEPGQVLTIPPLSGVPHTVDWGQTIDSIADMYGVRAGNIVGYPPNSLKYPYDLDVGQEIFVPGGIIDIPDYWDGGTRPPPTLVRMPGGEKLVWPTWGEITAPFGWSRAYGGYHRGLDIANSRGTPIYAAAAGEVIEAGWGSLGWHVYIDHGNGFVTQYGHMAKPPYVAVGDRVEKWDQIGIMGMTYGAGGYATGVHLHFAVLHHGVYIDPLPLLEN